MQKEAQALLDAALAFQKAGATEQQIRFTSFLKQGVMSIQISLPVELQGLSIVLSEISPAE